MRILIAGAGALGSLYGGFLRLAGHDVALLGRADHLDAIARTGLAIEGVFGEHRADGFELATDARELSGGFDLVVIAVRAYDAAAVAPEIAPLLGPSSAVLSLQNGLGTLEKLADVLARERLLGAPVLIGAALPSPGSLRVTVYAKPVQIGAPWPAPGRNAAPRVAEMLAAAGIPSEPTDRIFAYLWEKMLYNAPLNALGAILRRSYGELAADPESRAIMDRVIAEGFAVARADGADLLWTSLEECREHFYERLLPPTAGHRSSMLQAIERGRRTEIDALNGHLAHRGEALDVPTPTNALLASLVRALETGVRSQPSTSRRLRSR